MRSPRSCHGDISRQNGLYRVVTVAHVPLDRTVLILVCTGTETERRCQQTWPRTITHDSSRLAAPRRFGRPGDAHLTNRWLDSTEKKVFLCHRLVIRHVSPLDSDTVVARPLSAAAILPVRRSSPLPRSVPPSRTALEGVNSTATIRKPFKYETESTLGSTRRYRPVTDPLVPLTNLLIWSSCRTSGSVVRTGLVSAWRTRFNILRG